MGKARVLIAGGGPAGIEAALALHAWAGRRVETTLLSPDDHLSMPWLNVGGLLGSMPDLRRPLSSLLSDGQATHRRGEVARVDRSQRTVITADGERLSYDRLIVAVGARARPFLPPPAITFRGVGDVPRVRALVDGVIEEALAGADAEVSFVVPPGPVWPLPAYELALGSAWLLEEAGARIRTRISLVTSEPRPLSLFGTTVSSAVAEDLASADVRSVAAAVVRAPGGRLIGPSGEAVELGHAVVLPCLSGPAIDGLPSDARGFVQADGQCRVRGQGAEFVAGDAGSFPVKQGGIACQQADVVASIIARELGAECEEVAFDPVLRGVLWSGTGRRYMRATLSGGREEMDGATSVSDPLWTPGTKVAGVFLSAVLADADGEELVDRAPSHA